MGQVSRPPQPALKILRVLAAAISQREVKPDDPTTFLSYSEVLRRLHGKKPWYRPGNRLQKLGLTVLNVWTMEYPDLPKIAALIVSKGSHRPSDRFFESHGFKPHDPEAEHWWLSEARRAATFDWWRYIDQPQGFAMPPDMDSMVREQPRIATPRYEGVITIEPGKRGGRPCIRGMRITVGDVLGWLSVGMTEEEIIDDFPELTRSDIHAALAFAANREKRAKSVGHEIAL